MQSTIDIHGLHKKFGKVHAVRGIDLSVPSGTIYGLIGPNGAGKSTVLRMLVDIIRPTEGSIAIFGQEPRRAPSALRQRIGYLPGEVKLTERSNGKSVLEHFKSISRPVEAGTIESLAERLDLDLHRPVRTLSKGNRQKLGLIQAFMHRPELLILDEPTSGLDPLMQREFLSLIREARNGGSTVLLSSHILGEIQHTADAAAVLAHGSIVADGDIASLRLAGASRLRTVVTGTDAQTLRSELERHSELTELQVRDVGDSTTQASGLLRGTPDALLSTLTRHPIRDLILEEPDLEESILELYENSRDAA